MTSLLPLYKSSGRSITGLLFIINSPSSSYHSIPYYLSTRASKSSAPSALQGLLESRHQITLHVHVDLPSHLKGKTKLFPNSNKITFSLSNSPLHVFASPAPCAATRPCAGPPYPRALQSVPRRESHCFRCCHPVARRCFFYEENKS